MRSVIVLGILAAFLGIVPASSSCSGTNQWISCPTADNKGSSVDISAGATRPGSPPPENGGPATPPTAQPTPEEEEEECGPLGCRYNYEVGGLPDVTLADLASFRPAAPQLTGEPAGFGVVGMPTNLVGEASEQRIPGTILDWDVTVRFVPAAYVFVHGDGTSATASTGGASWSRLGQAQFTPTATSHVYAERGAYPVSVTVRYAASVDFGSGAWIPVDGFVTATSGTYDVEVVEVRTALVDKTCRENPSGPGC